MLQPSRLQDLYNLFGREEDSSIIDGVDLKERESVARPSARGSSERGVWAEEVENEHLERERRDPIR